MDDSDSAKDRDIDETLRESFPASDAPANTGETGIRIGDSATASEPLVTDNRAASRFELHAEGGTAILQYKRTPDTLTLIHTEVPTQLRGRHLGERLVKAALDAGRSEGLRIVPQCPFVQAYLRKHPDR